MKKSWTIQNKTERADIWLYGEIVNEPYFDNDVTAKMFAEDLKSLGGKDITVHINSTGGDVFQAIAIYNGLKSYPGKVTTSIEGICASAATLIACGGTRITAASNALYMIHPAAVYLSNFYNLSDVEKIKSSLEAVKQAIIQTYKERLEMVQKTADFEKLMETETWLNAQEALEMGFIDEISGDVPMNIDNRQNMLFVNKINVDLRKFDESKIRKAMGKMDEQNFFDKLKAALTEALNPQQIREDELNRIRDLQAQKCDNNAVNAIIDVAIREGKTLSQVSAYISAVKSNPSNDPVEKIAAIIRDQMQSGAQKITSEPKMTAEEVQKMQAAKIAEYANRLTGGK